MAKYAAAVRPRYRTARKGAKGEILDEFRRVTGHHRKAAVLSGRLNARCESAVGPGLWEGRCPGAYKTAC